MAKDDLPYQVTSLDVISEVPDLRVIVITLAHGQEVPWHYHTKITDSFFCLAGPMVVEFGNEGQRATLEAGDSHAVPPGTPHRTRGLDNGPCRFLIVQGIGEYDFKPLDK